ncbi:MAG TPA: hypothetical protein VNH22_03405 [Blastocatellia bacterium]|jgi:hypothetical protein|nr:hypothetical protein [Blastocatellia bacterium]
MSGKGNLVFDFFNVNDERLDDRVDVLLKHQELSDTRQARNHPAAKSLRFENLDSTHGGTYQLQIFPARYRPVGRFVRVLEGKTARHAFQLPVDPDRVIRADFPPFDSLGDDMKRVLENSSVEGNESAAGADLYGALDNFRKAGLLNIYAKMKRTRFPNGRDVFSYVSSMNRIRAQRFFARVQKELRDEVKNSIAANLFHEASEALHTPPPGFSRADSFKSRDMFGNLQLSFFGKSETLEFIIDADLDDAQGIQHVFQVLRPVFTGMNTHPYDIHEILLAHQKIDPMYRLFV